MKLYLRVAVGMVIATICTSACSSFQGTSSGTDKSSLVVRSRQQGSQKIIIFVHGLFGDSDTSWTNSTGQSWLEMIERDQELEGYTLATYQYDSPYFNSAPNLVEIATELSAQLDKEGVFRNYSEIYFIAHSMGGLVVKEMLTTLSAWNETKIEKLRRVKAVLYISTPSKGAQVADLIDWLGIAINPQVRTLSAHTLNVYLGSLEKRWTDLIGDRGAEQFPRSYGAYETKNTIGFKIVNEFYATSFYDEDLYPVDEDHISIVKPASSKSRIYQWARTKIKAAGNRALTGVLKPLGEYQKLHAVRLERDYPLGYVLVASNGARNLTIAQPTPDIVMRPVNVGVIKLSATIAVVPIPDVFTASSRGTMSNNMAELPRKKGYKLNLLFGAYEAGEFGGVAEILENESDGIIWAIGFRPIKLP